MDIYYGGLQYEIGCKILLWCWKTLPQGSWDYNHETMYITLITPSSQVLFGLTWSEYVKNG